LLLNCRQIGLGRGPPTSIADRDFQILRDSN